MLVEVLNAEMLNSEYIFERANFCSNMSDSEINSRNYQVKELLIFSFVYIHYNLPFLEY